MDIRKNTHRPRGRMVLTALAAGVLIAIAATPSVAERPNEKGCPGETTWDFYLTQVLAAFGINPGQHIQDNCLN